MQTEWLKTTPVAHRGLHDNDTPENSMGAFENAVKAGCAAELDVHLTKDSRLVVVHDNNLLRMTGEAIDIKKSTLEEIQSHPLKHTWFRVPELGDVLDHVAGRIPLLIEVKNEGSPGRLERRLASRLDSYTGDFALMSFNPLSVRYLRRIRPAFTVGQLSSEFNDTALGLLRRFSTKQMAPRRPDFIAFQVQDLPNRHVEKLREQGIPALAWTVANRWDLDKARRYCDNYIFEHLEPPFYPISSCESIAPHP